jgi:hypothetical protein
MHIRFRILIALSVALVLVQAPRALSAAPTAALIMKQGNLNLSASVALGVGRALRLLSGPDRLFGATDHVREFRAGSPVPAPKSFPTLTNWLIFLAAAGTVAFYIVFLTPIRRLRRVQRTRAAPVWNLLIGGTLFTIGLAVTLFGLTWIWAADLVSSLAGPIQSLLTLVPISGLPDLLNAGPYVSLAVGLVIAGIGFGILRWVNLARLAAITLGLLIFSSTVAVAPMLLLLPEEVSGQALAMLAAVEIVLFLTAKLIQSLSSPEIRLRYAE